MRLVLDSGALVALERNTRAMWRRFKAAQLAGVAKALAGIEVRPLDDSLGRIGGELLGVASADDVIDASLVLLAQDGDCIVTSDPAEIARLAAAAGLHVEIIPA